MDEAKKARLGNRFTCYSCGTHFYDLHKPDPICPKCNADQREQPAVEPPKRTRKKAAKKKKAKINRSLVEEEEVAATDAEVGVEELGASEIALDMDD